MTHRSKVTEALCAVDPNHARREMADPEFSDWISDMWSDAHSNFEQFKQIAETLPVDVKAKLLWHFTAAWHFLDDEWVDHEKVQTHKKNKGGSHAVANS